jgi:signal transduction histidine kinase
MNSIPKIKQDIAGILDDLYNDTQSSANHRILKYKLEIEPDLPKLLIDRDAFYIMIKNLMYNAVRFTNDYGSITLGARRALFPEERLYDKTSVVIYVKDTGIGIIESEHENILKPFYELGELFAHRSGFLDFKSAGLGIGLAATKRICELFGGKIWLQSVVDEGSTFFIALPI